MQCPLAFLAFIILNAFVCSEFLKLLLFLPSLCAQTMAVFADPGREMLQGLQYPEVPSKSRPKRARPWPFDLKGLTSHDEATPWDV